MGIDRSEEKGAAVSVPSRPTLVASCILTHHDVRPWWGRKSTKSVRLMSLVFPESTEMSTLLRVRLDSAPVLVVMSSTLKVERVSVLELWPEVWEKWKRKSKAGTEVHIVKLPGGGGNPITAAAPPQLPDDQMVVEFSESDSLIDIFQKLWTIRPNLQSEEEYHRKPLRKWLKLTELNRKEDDCSSSTLRLDVFFLGKHVGRVKKLLNFSGAIAIRPSLVLDLVFENTLSNARHQLSTIKAWLRAELKKPSWSRWGNEKLTLSCACSSSPSAVSVRKQHSESRLHPSEPSFQVKKRGLNNQVKFEAEVDDPSVSSSALVMEVHATWDVLFHSPAPFRYEFSISQTGMATTPKPKELSWCQALTIYHA